MMISGYPDFQMATFDYGNFVLTLQTGECTPYFEKEGPEVRYGTIYPKWLQNATRIDIYGTKRMMIVGRMGGGWQVFDKKENIVAQDKGIFPLKAHILNYIDCIRTRKQPNGYIVETVLNDKNAQSLSQLTYRPGFEIKNEV